MILTGHGDIYITDKTPRGSKDFARVLIGQNEDTIKKCEKLLSNPIASLFYGSVVVDMMQQARENIAKYRKKL